MAVDSRQLPMVSSIAKETITEIALTIAVVISAFLVSNVVPSPSVPHTAARVIFLKHECDHNTPLLKTLHWLPISLRIRALKIASCSGFCLHLHSHLSSIISALPTAHCYPTTYIFQPAVMPKLFAVFQRHLGSLSSLGLCACCPPHL